MTLEIFQTHAPVFRLQEEPHVSELESTSPPYDHSQWTIQTTICHGSHGV